MERNAYLIKRAMGNFLFASVVTMLINQLTATVDGIIVGHIVCPDALAAITLFIPVSLVITAMNTFVGIGATILAAKAMGRRDKAAVSGILSTALACVLIVGVCFAVLGFLFSDTVTSWLTTDPHLAPQLKPYLVVMLGFAIMPMLSQFVNQCISVDGHPIKVTQAVVLIFITNTALDLLLVGVVGMGIQGSAIATICAYTVSILYLIRHLFSPQSDVKFRKPVFSKWLLPNLAQGTPMLISNVVLMLMLYTINTIVQNRLGHDGMFVMSVCMNILMIGLMLSNGFGETILSLGGFLYGQLDFTGTRMLVKRCLWCIVGITLTFSLFVILFPGLLTQLFGANTPELLALANTGVRIFIVCLTPVCLTFVMANLFQMVGRIALSPIVILLLPVSMLSLLWVFANSANESLIWYAFPVSGCVVLLVIYIITLILRIKSRPERLVPFLLLPMDNSNRLYEVSLKNDIQSFHKALSSIHDFIKPIEVAPKLRYHIEACTEELLLNTIQHAGIADNGRFTDMRLIQADDKISFSLKYEGKAFNPLTLAEDAKKIGMKIVTSYCYDMDYKYMYGQNMLFLSWATTTLPSDAPSLTENN